VPPIWTKENRTRYSRDKLRYPSDLIDAEWSLVEPLIPPARGGNKRRVNLREIVNGRSKLCKEHDPKGHLNRDRNPTTAKPAATSPPPAVAGVVTKPEQTISAARLTARLCPPDIRKFGFIGLKPPIA
jgi:hypothetical protein